ncbi:MAG: DMT family transporter [Phycisphaerae bacterium]|nr:DMT family transporter [Phycisphaerae bacterium]
MNEHLSKRRFDGTATLACIGALCFWSLGPNFIEYLTDHLDAWTQNLLRYSIACLFWLPFLVFSIYAKRLDTRIWRLALLPAAANIIMQSLWAAAFYYIEPALMVLLTKTTIIWIAGFSLMFFPEERVLIRSKRFLAGLGLCVVGVVGVLYFGPGFEAKGTMTGVIIALVCAFMWGMYTVTVRAAFRDIDSRAGFSVISIYTVVGLSIVAAKYGNVAECLNMGLRPWVVVVASAVMCIALAHVFYYAAIRRIGATIPALVILAQPFAVLAISYVAFGESLNAFQLIFGVMLLIGAALAIWAQQHLKPRDHTKISS